MSSKLTETSLILNGTNILDLLKPIGFIFQTSDSTFNPNTIWTGTWERITDKFLAAVGTTFTEQGGGSRYVTITADNLPVHTHTITPVGTVTNGSQYVSGPSTTLGNSGGHSHGCGDFYFDSGWSPYLQSYGSGSGTGCMSVTTSSASNSPNSDYDCGGLEFNAGNGWSGNTSTWVDYYGSAMGSSHTHTTDTYCTVTINSAPTISANAQTLSSSGSASETIETIPPCETVYIWKRVS